jgi:hypothetical protein
MTPTYCCRVTSLPLRQLPDTQKTQLTLLLHVDYCCRDVFTAALHSNEHGAARHGLEKTPLSLLLPVFFNWKQPNLS